jgi:hypothetical protein
LEAKVLGCLAHALLIPCIVRNGQLDKSTISCDDAAAAAEALDATLVSGNPELAQLESKLAIEKLERTG